MWKIQGFYFPIHTLCEKRSTFYITIVISLLLQATGNKARNRRRWTEDTWLLFGSQVFRVKRRDCFPFRAFNSVSPIHTTTGWPGSAKPRSSARVTWPSRLTHDLPGNSDHQLPRHTLKPGGEKVTGIQAREEAISHAKIGKMFQHTWLGRGRRREKDSPGEQGKQTHRGVKIHSMSQQQWEPNSRNIMCNGETPGGDTGVWNTRHKDGSVMWTQ